MTNEKREYRQELWDMASEWASRITSSTGTGRIRFVRENKRVDVRSLHKDSLTGATFMSLLQREKDKDFEEGKIGAGALEKSEIEVNGKRKWESKGRGWKLSNVRTVVR